MEIHVSNVITIDNPTQAVRDYCENNLVIPNPEYEKKARMGFWTGNTPAVLSLYETRDGKLILPYGTLDDLYDLEIPIPERDFPSYFGRCWHPVDFGAPDLHLYEYQRRARIKMCRDYLGILQAPAGSGKTQIGIAIIVWHGLRALWLTHTKDLLQQSYDRAKQYIDKSLLGKITEGRVNIGKGITFATVQTMARLDLSQYRDEWDVIVVDECHRVAGSPTAMTQFYKVLNNLNAPYKYGLSATVHRADGMIRATYALLGRVKYTVPPEAVAARVMRVGVTAIDLNTPISSVYLNPDGTMNYTKLISYLCDDRERCDSIVHELMMNSQHPSLILSARLDHLERLMTILPDALQRDAVMISGKMATKKGKAKREAAIEDMRTGRKKYLFATYSLAKEGLDIPCLERLYLTTPQTDYAVVTQSIGRVARTSEGKHDPLVYDFVDSKIGYLFRCYKKRVTIYRKNGCYFV